MHVSLFVLNSLAMRPILLMLAASLITSTTLGCSAFIWTEQSNLFGRNFDWYSGTGYVIKNNRGLSKYAYRIGEGKPAQWTSKFGSVTFNQIGKEFPYGGINEKGLIVEQLWLHSTTYANNHNSTISELEWIQYQLDNFSTVDEVLAALHSLTIKPIKATVHYFVADKNGNAASIDFIGGKTIINRKEGKKHVLTNTDYQSAVAYNSKHKGNVNVDSRLSEDRYCQIEANLEKLNPNSVDNAFEILNRSAEYHPNYKTFWQIVYDLDAMEINFRSYGFNSSKTIRLSDLDFSTDLIYACDINTSTFTWIPYTYAQNKNLLFTSLQAMGIELDFELAAIHQYEPNSPRADTIYPNRYGTARIHITTKNNSGYLYYTLAQGEANFNQRRGAASVMLKVDSNFMYSEAYAIPKGEYALASFHDVNGNKKMDTGWFGIPIEPYAFILNKKSIFGLPPKYSKIKFPFSGDVDLKLVF